MMPPSIYSYIKAEEALFQTDEVQVGQNWFWNMRRHVQLIFHLKNGIFFTGENNWLRAFKNIMEPMLSLAYWTEDLEVKDATFFIEEAMARVLSFLVKKYHDEVYVREHDLDTLFDEITESDIDYGGVLVQKAKGRPEVLPLNSIAFCDQTNILSAPIGFKHHFAPEGLRDKASLGWGNPANGATISLDELIVLAGDTKSSDGSLTGKQNKVPGKTVEVYIVKGNLPDAYLKDDDNFDDTCSQVQVVAFYTDKNKKQHGVTLYRKEDDGESLFFHTSQKVYGRALGRGAGEALLPAQVWTNFLEIHKMQMLESGAKTPLVTDDPAFTNRNKIQEMENNEITTIEDGKKISAIPTINIANVQLYEKSIDTWFQHAQLTGAAFDPLLGVEQSSGGTFRGQERTVAQGRGSHDRRRGQRAKFVELLYRKLIIPDITREITKDTKFLATLSLEEMTWVADQMAEAHVTRRIIDGMLDMKLMTPEERDLARQVFKDSFVKSGNKKLIKILKEDFKGIELRMGINIAGKQKDLVNLSDKLLSVFQFIFANPAGFQQAMQIPALATSFNDLLEFSGMSQANFSTLLAAPPVQQAQPQGQGPQPGQPAPTIALNPPAPAQA